ncbi:MAG: asparagine synthase [Thaumarchaeota archaeon]|nr:asparagine synthase [Nitrososphaerota archaeon]
MARAVAGENMVAVAFSGGVDSSVLAVCAKRSARVVAYTDYSDASGDGAKAKSAAASMGVEIVTTKVTERAVARELARLDLPFEPTIMDKSLWCLYSLAAQSAAAAGARVMLLGQLADELFGGYAKYSRALGAGGQAEAKAMMDADIGGYDGRGRVRDVGACSRWVQPMFPFGDPEVKEFAATLPLSFKITSSTRKAVLRRAAVILGVPEEIAASAKKAAQYSSGMQKLVAGSRF